MLLLPCGFAINNFLPVTDAFQGAVLGFTESFFGKPGKVIQLSPFSGKKGTTLTLFYFACGHLADTKENIQRC